MLKKPSQADCAEGISAVKALAIAQEQGQKVYTINQSNRDTALPKLSIGEEMGAQIRSAIQARKEVIFHENRINANGWTGYGYLITDQETGAGGYIIEERGSGGFLAGSLAFLGLPIYGMGAIGLLGAFFVPIAFGFMGKAMWNGWRSACKV